jgi:hypothetical protein
MSTWQSESIAVDGIEVQVHSSREGVVLGKVVDGVYASDLLLSDTNKARSIACALIEGADKADAARGG